MSRAAHLIASFAVCMAFAALVILAAIIVTPGA